MIVFCVFLILTLFGCKMKKNDILLNSAEQEWRLDKINGKTPHSTQVLYLIFHKDYTYDIYYKRGGKRYNESTDIPIDQKWNFDKKENLYIADFQKNLKLIQLDKKNLVFTRELILTEGTERYSFVCDVCK